IRDRTVTGVQTCALPISERLTQFTGPAELHGTVGSTLPQELVLEVRDTTGAPFVGQPVTITTSSGGGTVTPSAAESDTSGVVRRSEERRVGKERGAGGAR